jgi:serine protease Do
MKHDKLIAVAILTCACGYCTSLVLLWNAAFDNRTSKALGSAATHSESLDVSDSSSLSTKEPASAKLSVRECGFPEERSNTSLLIQEPLKRSAYRPDFTGSLRNSNQRSNFFMLQAFKEAIDDSLQCTVQVFCNGDQCAYGTIVDQDGWIITKASELDGEQAINCVLHDQREFKADLVSTVADLDLALLHIPINGLTTVEWEYAVPDQGKWLATTDSSSELPAAIGVVSAGPSRIPNQRAVLGVELAPDDSKAKAGAKIKHVLVGSGAYLAGLRHGDIISSMNDSPVQSRDELLALLRSGKGGQFLNFAVHRNDELLELRVRLMDLSYELLDETELEVNGPISARATGFNRVFMHDTVLQPNQCGGPVVNLDGKAVGINIARAGRVSTYALPADAVRPAVQGLLEHAKLVSHPVRSLDQNIPPAQDASDTPFATAP